MVEFSVEVHSFGGEAMLVEDRIVVSVRGVHRDRIKNIWSIGIFWTCCDPVEHSWRKILLVMIEARYKDRLKTGLLLEESEDNEWEKGQFRPHRDYFCFEYFCGSQLIIFHVSNFSFSALTVSQCLSISSPTHNSMPENMKKEQQEWRRAIWPHGKSLLLPTPFNIYSAWKWWNYSFPEWSTMIR